MTSPVTSPLVPTLTGRTLTLDAALNTPTIIRNQIAKLADPMILLPKFLRQYGTRVSGGGILYNSIAASDFFTSDVEKRIPGAEYRVVEGVDPDPKLAVVEDWGGKFQVPEEAILRNNVNYLDQQTTQLANTITRKLDNATMAAIGAAPIASVAVATTWDNLVFVGDLSLITPSGNRPTAHFAQAQQLADLEELGVSYDLLICAPEQAMQLRTAYAEGLDDMLASAGFTNGMFVSARIPAGTVYLVQKGNVGTVGFEAPLTVETWRDPATRSWFVQAFAVPAIAVDRPYAAKKLTAVS